MVKYKDILVAVIDKLEDEFPNITVESNDISEGFDRPSFFVHLDNIKAENFMWETQDNYLTVRIIYFPADKNKNQDELLQMQDDLRSLFLEDNIIRIDIDISAEIEEIELDVVDKVLHCSFDLVIYQEYCREQDEDNMEDLEYQGEGLIWRM